MRIGIFDFKTDLGGLVEHGGHGTVFLLRQANGIFHGFVAHLPRDAINQADGRVDHRGVGSAFAFGAHLDCREGFPLLAENGDDVGGGASAERHEYEFDRAGGEFVFTSVEDNSMAGSGVCDETVVGEMGGGSGNHIFDC